MTGQPDIGRCAGAAPSPADDAGFSLVELLTAMALFTVLLAVFGAGINVMSQDVRHQLGQADGLDASRRVLAQLDQQVRYANAVNLPGVTGAAPNPTYWVEWQSGITNQQQTCTQWRLLPTGEMQVRAWQPQLSTGLVTPMPAFSTRAIGLSPPLAGLPFRFPDGEAQSKQVRQQLIVSFVVRSGRPPVATTSQVTLTAQNTVSVTAPAVPVCGGVGGRL